jgi:hypothetical protein
MRAAMLSLRKSPPGNEQQRRGSRKKVLAFRPKNVPE